MSIARSIERFLDRVLTSKHEYRFQFPAASHHLAPEVSPGRNLQKEYIERLENKDYPIEMLLPGFGPVENLGSLALNADQPENPEAGE